MKFFIKIKIVFVSVLLLVFFSCKKEYENPYDNITNTNPNPTNNVELDPATIAGIHANIFRPTCANSGCHDGTFEPDFRTIESSYNTLVNHSIIKNDPQGTYELRVKPNNADESQLIARLTFDIDGNSGIMPLVVDSGSDWDANKDAYIQNIKDWVQTGAKDIFGNSPMQGNGLPYMVGAAANGNGWIEREGGGQGTLRVNETINSLEIYIALKDDDTAANNLANNKIKISTAANDFSNATELDLQVLNTPIERVGFNGSNVSYYHKVTINPSDYAMVDGTAYFRVFVKDANNPITEIPTNGAANYIKTYFSFTIVQ